jgi:L-2-hydroxyglutarate oxidase
MWQSKLKISMPNSNNFDLIIVGGGILGAATLYLYQKQNPTSRVLLIEKESELASHQTARNSGVIHSGIYYKPNSLKAKNCREGLKLLYAFCKEFNVPHDNCGKLIIAKNDDEIKSLKLLQERGKQNGINGIQLLDSAEAKKYEPYLECAKALFVPDTGIVDYGLMAKELINQAKIINSNSVVMYNEKVDDFDKVDEVSHIKAKENTYKSKQVIFCTGLQSDRFARKDGIKLDLRVVPFRGDYYVLQPKAFHKVKNLIYPVADPDLPFLGVHLTRMMNGTIESGPNAVFSFDREGYKRLSFSFQDTAEAIGFAGTWKLFSKFWRTGIAEYRRAFSKRRFLRSLQEMVPSLTIDDLGAHRAGVRAQVVDKKGNLVDDFLIKKGNCGIHVINAPSPAATASLSIANMIIEHIVND